jgi:hypothetical protein
MVGYPESLTDPSYRFGFVKYIKFFSENPCMNPRILTLGVEKQIKRNKLPYVLSTTSGLFKLEKPNFPVSPCFSGSEMKR